MIQTTINGRKIYLFNERPEGGEFELTAKIIANQDSSLTDREERRGLAESVTLEVGYKIQAEGVAARTVEKYLREIGNDKVAVPIWPEAQTWANRAQASMTSGLYFIYRASAALAAVFEAGEPPGWQTDSDIVVPVVVGFLEEREVDWMRDSLLSFRVRLIENSPVEWSVQGIDYSALAGPNPGSLGTAPEVLPFPSAWSAPKQTHLLRIEREKIGFRREASETYRPAVAVARTLEQRAFLDPSEGWPAGKMLRWFADHGAGRSFWAPTQNSLAKLAADVPANAISLLLSPGEAALVSVGDYIAAVSGSRVVCTFGPVSLISGNAVYFAAGTTPALAAAKTRLVALVLCRLSKPEIKIGFYSSRLAMADFMVRELPPESGPAPANEVAGVTIGKLPTRAWLYTFTRAAGASGILGEILSEDANYITYHRNEDIVSENALTITSTLGGAGGVVSEDDISITFVSAEAEEGVTDRFTSFEADLADDDSIFFSRSITHGNRVQGIALEQDKITLMCDGLNVPPILEAALLQSEMPCKVVVERCDVLDGVITNRETIFTGDLGKCSIDGKKLRATAVSGGTFFDLKAPRFYLQAGCNHALFSEGCGLLKSAWKHTAIVHDPGAPGYPFQFIIDDLVRTGGGSVLTAVNSFAGGWAEIGIGASMQRRSILESTAMDAAGRITITLQSDPFPYPVVGTPLSIFPGCDGAAGTCKSRFGNYANFGGHPKVPKGNPSLFKLSSNVGSGGKK